MGMNGVCCGSDVCVAGVVGVLWGGSVGVG